MCRLFWNIYNYTFATEAEDDNIFCTRPTIMSKIIYKSSALSSQKKSRKPRSLLFRNAWSPYMEGEVKSIKQKDFVIIDEKKRSPLGKPKVFPCVEDIEFATFLKAIGLVD